MSKKIEKATFPTSQYKVLCDTFDVEALIKLHQTEGKETKLYMSLTQDKNKVSISLYKEDVESMIAYLKSVVDHTKPRTV